MKLDTANLEPIDRLRWNIFADLFPEEGHRLLAMHAAFPAALTSDLLYKIWLNFRTFSDSKGKNQTIPLTAVADLLSSSVCYEIGYDLFDLYPTIKDELLKALEKDPRFGPSRIRRLAQFLQAYLEHNPDKSPSKVFVEAQRFVALMRLDPRQAAAKIITAYNQEVDRKKHQPEVDFYLTWITPRNERLREGGSSSTQQDPLIFIEALTRGKRHLEAGNKEEALGYLNPIRSLLASGLQNRSGEVAVKISNAVLKELQLNLVVDPPADGGSVIHALLVALEQYDPAARISPLFGCKRDVEAVEGALHQLSNVRIRKLIDQQATKAAVLTALKEVIHAAYDEDHVFLFFAGHTDETEDRRNSIVLYDSRTKEGRDFVAQDLKEIMNDSSSNPYVFMVLDSGKDWLDSKNTKHVFISGHPTNKDLPALDGGSFGVFISTLLEKVETQTYRSFFRTLLEHYQKQRRFRLRSQLFAHPSFTRNLIFQKDSSETNKHPTGQTKPIFLLVFSNPPDARIPDVDTERKALLDLFETATDESTVELITEHNPDSKRLEELFCSPNTRHRIQIFHFAGLVGKPGEQNDYSFGFFLADGLLDFFTFLPWLDFQENIHLAFLNACKSHFMAEWLAQLGVISAIGLEGHTEDQVFKEAGLRFYKEWLKGERNTLGTYSETISSDHTSILSSLVTKGNPLRDASYSPNPLNFQFHFYSFPWAENLLEATRFDYGPPRSPTFPKAGVENLYAVLIGINGYSDHQPLDGCINDVLIVSDYFQKLCVAQGEDAVRPCVNWHPVFLLEPKDEAERKWLKEKGIEYRRPTRQNIIYHFEHFARASPQTGDVCLFYFSGYGSYAEVPVFAEITPDGFTPTLVCADSREPGNRDLLDKELSYLIARSLEDKTPGVHWLTILDCSHSGSNTRSNDPDTRARQLPKGVPINDSSSILGFTITGNALYEPFDSEQSRVRVKPPSQIELSAARDGEQARELAFKCSGDSRKLGAFTHSLIKTLEHSGVNVSYQELVRRVDIEVRSKVYGQIPTLNWSGDQPLLFLDNRFKNPRQEFPLSLRDGEWYVHAGSLQGIESAETKLKLLDRTERIVALKEVGISESVLDGSAFTEKDEDKLLRAAIYSASYQKISIWLSDLLPEDRKEELLRVWEREQPNYIRLAADQKDADYEVKPSPAPDENFYYIVTRLNSEIPLFFRTSNSFVFIGDLDKMAKWEIVLKMSQPSDIPRDDIQVEVKKLEGISFHDAKSLNEVPEELYQPIAIDSTIQVAYKITNGELNQPAIQVTINNNSAKDYVIGALFFSDNFGISNDLLEIQWIEPKSKVKLHYDYKREIYNAIPLMIQDRYLEFGVTEIKAYLLIYVGIRFFTLSQYPQSPIALEVKRDEGFVKSSEKITLEDLLTIKIPIHLVRPIEPVLLRRGIQALAGINIQFPINFSATMQPANQAAAHRLANHLRQEKEAFDSNILVPSNTLWTGVQVREPTFSNNPAATSDFHLSIMELTETIGEISEDRPLVFIPTEPLPTTDSIVPFGYDAEKKRYFPIGYTDEVGRVILTKLPKPTAGVIKGSGVEPISKTEEENRSIKLFFKRLAAGKLSGQLAEFKMRGEVTSSKDFDENEGKEALPKTQALLIGIDRAPGNGEKIKGCKTDVEIIEDVLNEIRKENEGPIVLQKLINEEATIGAVRKALDNLKSLKKGDSFFLYFAGSSTGGSEKNFEIDFKGPHLVLFEDKTGEPALLTQRELEDRIYSVVSEQEVHCSLFLNPPALHEPKETLRTGLLRRQKENLKGSLIILNGSSAGEKIQLTFNSAKGAQSFFSYGLQQVFKEKGSRLSYKDLLEATTEVINKRLGKQHPKLEAFPESAENLLFLTGDFPPKVRPILFFVFASESQFREEQHLYYEAFAKARTSGAIEYYSTVDPIFEMLYDYDHLKKFGNRLHLFHWSGPQQDLLIRDYPGRHRENLATDLGRQKNLQLVFLNRAASITGVEFLLDRGVKAVIATPTRVGDRHALYFATQFYQALAGGLTIRQAFDRARAEVFLQSIEAPEIGTYDISEFPEISSKEFPWGLYIKDETTLDWHIETHPLATPE